MIIDCISDLHGYRPEMPGGDMLIIAGDLTGRDQAHEYLDVALWIEAQNYDMKILVGGNHDNKLQEFPRMFDDLSNFTHLLDSGFEYAGLKIWGSPWTKTFEDMNPYCKAFTVDTEEELAEKFKEIPSDVDILITHSPPYTILDRVLDGPHVGCEYLMGALLYCFRPKLWVFGHIHEAYGKEVFKESTICVNASYVNEKYKPVNDPVRIIL